MSLSKHPSLRVDTSSSSLTTPSTTSSVSGSRRRDDSRSPETLRGRSPSRPPVPESSPSNPFRNEFEYEYFDDRRTTTTATRGWSFSSIRSKMVKRNYMPTPLGYGVLAFLILTGLYLVSPSTEGGVKLLPSSWDGFGIISNSEGEGWITSSAGADAGAQEGFDDSSPPPPLLPLPYIYHTIFPSKTIPKSLLTPRLYPLATRLVDFLHRPILSHEDAKTANDKGCPRDLSDKLVNPDQYNGDSSFWMNDVTTDEIAKRRGDIVKWIAERVENGEEVLGAEGKTGSGRGIVLTGGNQDTTFRTITAIKHLRRLDVTLPIEVFHYSDELTDQNQRKEIEDLGATLREAEGLTKVDGVWKNWQIKGLALVQSSFREILYLDSDNTPLRSPTHLFDAPIYTSSGRAAFWPDLSKDHPDNAIWRLIGDSCSLDLWTFESGQIVIDKAGNNGLNFAALVIAAGMMNDREFWFHMCGGDKDTFRWAFRALGLDFGVSPRWMSTVGIKNSYDGGRFCGHSVLQYDLVTPEGFTRPPPLFVHSNLLKHLGGTGLSRGGLFQQIRRMSDDDSSNPSLNYAHSFVYIGPGRGMCLDLDWHDHVPENVREEVGLQTLDVSEEEGGVFDGFEETWFEEGGRIGGW
ncbi:hypothetical protein CI109_100080 [Kwoniella shandongensis]|uniref:Uncharacterized protein n=1 Tax=Kwoniella shandongensis TaxID=1734106 RepID=A0A5M6BX99_9TREE|nr:uncharacterized protein CI109_005947 [Kwoniella shandongensis]KAA5525639.1 hypothetical protein CI109_005947 [Kwoniella shandongensis]